VTSAVVATLLETGITTIGLNVEHDNAAAIQAYERIGFRTSSYYFEGVANRSASESENPAGWCDTKVSAVAKIVPGL
jgi:ribosomal protein S18 acetylase RimI-like enzyme